MQAFDARYQTSFNGALTPEIISRIQALRNAGHTFNAIGQMLGLSGSFIAKLIDATRPANIRSSHIADLVRALDHHDQLAGIAKPPSSPVRLSDQPLEELLMAIAAKGYNISLSPRR
jgi:hypothetical protein